MLDWQIKPLAKKSALSDREIKAGDTVVCTVFINQLGQLDRIDAHKDEFDDSKVEGRVIGKWERTVGEHPEADERAARRMSLESSEDFFVSLFDTNTAVETDEVDVVKQMLALLLERKRILRPVGRPSGGFQKYIQPSTKREFLVPQKNLDEDLVIKIQNQLGSIII